MSLANLNDNHPSWEELRKASTTEHFVLNDYSRLSLSQIPRDSLKYFEISVLRHIRFAELGKN